MHKIIHNLWADERKTMFWEKKIWVHVSVLNGFIYIFLKLLYFFLYTDPEFMWCMELLMHAQMVKTIPGQALQCYQI